MSLYVDIKKKYKGFDLEVAFTNNGESLGILGASGSGKSMTLKCIAGLISPDEGIIKVGDRVLFDSAAKIDVKPQLRNVGYLFQNYALFPNMTVRENINLAYRGEKTKMNDTVDGLLSLYGLSDFANRYPVSLSGGQQQRAALARIFAYNPELLLLDEPFSALDTFLRERMQVELKHIIKNYEGDVVMVTHSRDEVYKICNRLMVLDNGEAATLGETEEVFRTPGNVRTARITGCKNISKIEKTGETSFIASDWGIEFNAAKPIENDCTHVGIRAHDFSIVEEDSIDNVENLIKIEVDEVIRGIFEKSIVFRSATHVEGDTHGDDTSQIWWSCNKNKPTNYVKYLSVNKDDFLLLKS